MIVEDHIYGERQDIPLVYSPTTPNPPTPNPPTPNPPTPNPPTPDPPSSNPPNPPTSPTSSDCHELCCYPIRNDIGGWANEEMLQECESSNCQYRKRGNADLQCTGNGYARCLERSDCESNPTPNPPTTNPPTRTPPTTNPPTRKPTTSPVKPPTRKPTTSPVKPPTKSPVAKPTSTGECTEGKWTKWFFKMKGDGSVKTQTCDWLAKLKAKKRAKLCKNKVDSSDEYSTPKQSCPVSCESCPSDPCDEAEDAKFVLKLKKNGAKYKTCGWLAEKTNAAKICKKKKDSYNGSGPPAEVCPVTCNVDSC